MIVDQHRIRLVPAGDPSKPGRHRAEDGEVVNGRITGRTPAQFRATVVIRRHGGDLKPRTRRAR